MISFVEEVIAVGFLFPLLGQCAILVGWKKFCLLLYVFLAVKLLLNGLFRFHCAKSL